MSRAASPSKSLQPAYLFVAAKPDGGRSMGLRQARSERALAAALKKDRMVLLRTWVLPAWLTPEPKFTLKDQMQLNEQLAGLLSRGVPLVEALEVCASVVSPPNRPRIERMRELVQSGSSFAEACRQQGVFDRVTIAVYQASERTGDLAGAAAQLAATARRQLEIAGKIQTALIYPCVVLFIAFAAGTLMLTVVVPMIGQSLRQAQMQLPWYTDLLVDTGLFIRSALPVLALCLALLAALVFVARTNIARFFAKVSRGLPVIRGVALTSESARFFSVMAAMTRAGVPLADALGTGVEAIGHPVLREELRTLRTRLVEGGVFRNLIEKVEAFPLAVRRLLIAADRAGDLETAFSGLADDQAKELGKRTDRLLALLEPLLIVFVFLIIGTLVLSLMIPMLTLSSQNL